MHVKKMIVFTMFMLMSVGICGYSNDTKQQTVKEEKGVEINAENFPSEYVRELVSESFDSNNDNQLSQNEIDAVTELRIDPDDTYISMKEISKGIKEIDVSKAKKIDKIYVKKYQNVKKGDKQQIKIIRR